MSCILTKRDEALASYAASHHSRPVTVCLGGRKFTQLLLEAAQSAAVPGLRTAAGRPLAYRNLELLRDEVNLDALRIL